MSVRLELPVVMVTSIAGGWGRGPVPHTHHIPSTGLILGTAIGFGVQAGPVSQRELARRERALTPAILVTVLAAEGRRLGTNKAQTRKTRPDRVGVNSKDGKMKGRRVPDRLLCGPM